MFLSLNPGKTGLKLSFLLKLSIIHSVMIRDVSVPVLLLFSSPCSWPPECLKLSLNLIKTVIKSQQNCQNCNILLLKQAYSLAGMTILAVLTTFEKHQEDQENRTSETGGREEKAPGAVFLLKTVKNCRYSEVKFPLKTVKIVVIPRLNSCS